MEMSALHVGVFFALRFNGTQIFFFCHPERREGSKCHQELIFVIPGHRAGVWLTFKVPACGWPALQVNLRLGDLYYPTSYRSVEVLAMDVNAAIVRTVGVAY